MVPANLGKLEWPAGLALKAKIALARLACCHSVVCNLSYAKCVMLHSVFGQGGPAVCNGYTATWCGKQNTVFERCDVVVVVVRRLDFRELLMSNRGLIAMP